MPTSTCRTTSVRAPSASATWSPTWPPWSAVGPTWRSSARRSTTPSAADRGTVRAARHPPGDVRRGRALAAARHRDRGQHLDVVDAGDANVVPAWLERGHAIDLPQGPRGRRRAARCRIILGGDHSITWPSASAVATAVAPRTIGIVHFDAHADTGRRPVGRARRPRHADASAHRVRRGQGQELRPGRACAATGRGPKTSPGCASRACAGTR